MNALLLVTAGVAVALLLSPQVREDRTWRATVTPLASIIGSGFLVVVPLLAHAAGAFAPLAMAAVVLTAWLLGGAIRFNILHVEPLLHRGSAPPAVLRLERLSDLALGLAYVVSVTFYLRLLASFAMAGIGLHDRFLERVLCSAVLVAIGVGGWWRGLGLLERLEEYAVSLKLGVIAAMLLGWMLHDVQVLPTFDPASLPDGEHDPLRLARILAGVLIVVQGFETSRYLGSEYPAPLRVRTMARAQLLSGAIYVLFVLVTLPSYPHLPHQVDETALVGLAADVAPILPSMLVLAALASQFSAAVADTVGAGGLLEQSLGRLGIRARQAYLLVAAAGLALVWSVDVLRIVALASRAFAFYYAVQCALAAQAALLEAGKARRLRAMAYWALALAMLAVTLFAEPAG